MAVKTKQLMHDANIGSDRKQKWMPAVLGTLVVMAYSFFSAWVCIPIPMVDSHLFVGTAVRYAQGHGLTHPAYFLRHLDPMGLDRVVTYPPLFPWLVGALMPSTDPRWAFLLIAAMRLAQVGLWAWLYTLMFSRLTADRPGSRSWLTSLFLIGIIAEAGGPREGRPEALVGLLTSVAVVLVLFLADRWHGIVLGIVLGLIGSAHPVGAIFSAGALAIYAGARWRLLPAIGFLALSGAISLVVFAGLLSLSPNGFWAVIHGASSAARDIVASAWGDKSAFLLSGRTPFSGVVLVAGFLSGAGLLARYWQALGSRTVVVTGAAVFTAAVWYFSVRAPERLYNALIFTPFYFAGLVWWSIKTDSRLFGKAWLPWIVAGLCCIGSLRYAIILGFYARSGIPLQQARSLVATEADRHPQAGISLPMDGLILFDDYSRLNLRTNLTEAIQMKVPLVVFMQPATPSERDLLTAASYGRSSGIPGPDIPFRLPSWSAGYAIEIYRIGEKTKIGRTELVAPPAVASPGRSKSPTSL